MIKHLLNKLFFCLMSLLPAIAIAGSDYTVSEVSSGIYYHQGVHEDATPENIGAIANVGFIIGDECVAVIDSGGSYLEGEKLNNALKQLTQKPVCYVINTHVHPDHMFGNAAFEQYKPIYIGHEKLADAITSRKEFFTTTFKDILKESFKGTKIISPSQGVAIDEPVTLDLGNRKITLTAYTTSHTDHDLTVFDQQTKTLWTGDLLFVDRIPVMDGSINGWISVMDKMLTLDLNHIIPGHGTPFDDNWQQAIKKQRNYFASMREQIRNIIFDFGTIDQASKTVGLKQKPDWLLFDQYHRRNITASFVELEWE